MNQIEMDRALRKLRLSGMAWRGRMSSVVARAVMQAVRCEPGGVHRRRADEGLDDPGLADRDAHALGVARGAAAGLISPEHWRTVSSPAGHGLTRPAQRSREALLIPGTTLILVLLATGMVQQSLYPFTSLAGFMGFALAYLAVVTHHGWHRKGRFPAEAN